jgi:hypothetical protein
MSTITMSDFSFLTFIHNSSFINQHLVLDYVSKISYLDVVLINASAGGSTSLVLYNSYINDLYHTFSYSFLPLMALFSSSYQDIYSIVLLISPELIMAYMDYFNLYYASSFVNFQTVVCFDSYTNNLNYIFGEGVLTLFMFMFFA